MKRLTSTRSAGFSLIEALVASALVLLITLGIMPLFTNSVIQNLSGKESTYSTNYSRSRSEELVPLPFDRLTLRPPVGQTSRRICQDYEEGQGWEVVTCGAVPTGNPTWTREVFVQQFNIREIYDGDTAAGVPTFKNPVLGYPAIASRLDSSVHIRELMVITEGQRDADSPLGPGRRVDLVNLRAF